MKKLLLVLLLCAPLFAEFWPLGGSGGNNIPFVTPTLNNCLIGNGTAWVGGSCSAGSGTVTSVALTMPSLFSVTGSGGTTAVSLGVTLANAVNSANGLVQLNGSGYLPALNASLLTNFPIFNQSTTGTAGNITATSNSTLVTLSALSLPGSQVTGNISGNAANISETSNSSLTTLSSLSLPGSQVSSHVAADMVAVSPSTTGNVLTSNGTAWVSQAPVGVWTAYTVSTNNNTPTALATVSLAASTAYTCTAQDVTAIRTNGSDYGHFNVVGSFHTDGSSVCSMEDSTITYQKVSDAGFTVAWTCSGLMVTGNTSKNLDWEGDVKCTSVN